MQPDISLSGLSSRLDLPLGSHITTPRRGYLHHGIYVGGGNVVHYSGSSRGLYAGPVEEIPLDRFARGRPIWVEVHTFIRFDPGEVIQRARSRVGENHYRVFSNNCEHFCEWCLHGEQRSYQVEACKAIPHRALHAVIHLALRLIPLFNVEVQAESVFNLNRHVRRLVQIERLGADPSLGSEPCGKSRRLRRMTMPAIVIASCAADGRSVAIHPNRAKRQCSASRSHS